MATLHFRFLPIRPIWVKIGEIGGNLKKNDYF